MNTLWGWLRDLFGIGSSPPPPPTDDPCQAAACVNAQQNLKQARSGHDNLCRFIQALASLSKALQQFQSFGWILVLLLAIALVLYAILPIFGFLVMFVLSLLGFWVLSWVILIAVGKMAQVLVPELDKRSKAVMDAIDAVRAGCAPSCQGDLSAPTCAL